MSVLRYRPDIDGLRALAVLPVILYHARLLGFTGGYVGVDVFFVISGYLITGVIAQDVTANRFSLVRFYARRCRRILPALIFVILLSITVGLIILIPRDLQRLGQSVVASSAFVANVLFWIKTGYFEPAAESHPLLHLWSLAVEEQFYLLYPLLLPLLLQRNIRLARNVLGFLILASFVWSTYEVSVAPARAFFLPASRIWELLAGGVLYLLRADPGRAKSTQATALAAFGVTLIAVPVLLYTESTPFPGPTAALPVAGTMLLLRAGETGNVVSSYILSHPVAVGLGRVSYSLYLFHWPLLVFANHVAIRPLTVIETTFVLLLSVALSFVSFHFVEKPFRKGAGLPRTSDKRTMRWAAAGLVPLAMFGLFLHFANGLPGRVPEEVQKLAAGEEDIIESRDSCMRRTPEEVEHGDLCSLGAKVKRGTTSFLVWGDSHAQAISPAISAAAEAQGTSGLLASRGSCPPLLGVRIDGYYDDDCVAFDDAVLKLVDHGRVQTVFLVASWATLVQRIRNGAITVTGPEPEVFRRESPPETLEKILIRSIDSLLEKNYVSQVIVVETVPGARFSVPSVSARLLWWDRNEPRLLWTRPEHRKRNESVSRVAAHYQGKDRVVFLRPSDVFCSEVYCRAVSAQSVPFYADDNHLTVSGARTLVPIFAGSFASQPMAGSGESTTAR